MVNSGFDKSRRDSSLEVRRAALNAQIDRKKPQHQDNENIVKGVAEAGKAYNRSSLAMGFRLSADFLSAILVGTVLGMVLDKLAGTSPWGLMVLLFLGFAAGVMNIMRTLGKPLPYGRNRQSSRKSSDKMQ